MKAGRTFLKSVVVSLSLAISLVMISKAQALYVYEWYDSGVEWYTSPDDKILTTNGDKWEGFFTVPDSAMSHYTKDAFDGGYMIGIDVNQYLDFSLTGRTLSGGYIDATGLQGDAQAVHYIDSGYSYIIAGVLSYSMGDFNVKTTGDDHWLEYTDKVLDPLTNKMVTVSVSHDGGFRGYHIADSSPVPEPTTMLLFGIGLVGLVGARFRKKKK